nr:MAG TPA: hypothetical protein [Caudoviricetes sp.]
MCEHGEIRKRPATSGAMNYQVWCKRKRKYCNQCRASQKDAFFIQKKKEVKR